ncbi:autotransporter outer membrane beta-barrel domain-containing protein [Campylobacter mucosalis]|uniref:Putative autotransporter beta-domain protein n=1 Tax=Campylobacter mucosalis CCUG 21559 TaxID=1032067 RepID=A0A6G5QFR6_9BACT|nr:autotransporter outer membrane beta-barrel domain-containing protein [Campylobacter mucosalis]QCD44482.1 putative autotransporter beta-domain protein [Campylobacter mucosalis CCUG 21559]
MKFSKIACVALLSASISTVALAESKLDALNKAKADDATRTAGYNKILKAVNELKTIGYENLKNWNGDKTGEGTNKLSAELNTRIYNALNIIKEAKEDIKNTKKELKITKDSSTLKITQQGEIKILIKGDDNTAVNGGNENQELTLSLEDFKTHGPSHDKITQIFAENNKDVWDKFIEDFTKQHDTEQKTRINYIDNLALKFVTDTPIEQVTDSSDKYSAFIENKSLIENAVKVGLKHSQAEVAKATEKADSAIKNVDAKKLTLLSTDYTKIAKQSESINALKAELDKAKLEVSNQENNIKKADALKRAISAGVQLKRKNAEATLLTKDDIDAILAGGASKVTKDDFDHGGADSLTGDENIGKVLNALIGEVAQNGAYKAVENAQAAMTTVMDKIDLVTNAKDDIKKINETMAKYHEGTAKVTSSDEIAFFKYIALDNAIQNKQSDQIAKAQQELKNAANARATGVTKVANLEEKQGEVLGSFTDTVLANDTVKSIVTTYDAKELADTAKALNTSIEQSQRSQNKGTSTDIIMFNTGLATNTRLAKLSNPFNADLALAQAINELEGETFADAGDSLSSVIKEYTNRFNHDNNLWGNIFGGKGKIKDSANPSIWGVTLGYDKAFDNTIVGGFINYAKVQSKDSQVRSESDNYSFGVYSRSYFDQSEIDAKIGYGFGRNELSRHAMDSKIGTSTGKYDSKFFDVDVEYGYVFGLGNAMFIKPIAGLSYTHIKHDGFTEDGNVPAIFGNTTLKTLKAKLGSEFRVYTDNAGYFYITPGVERELSKSANDLSVKFVGSSKDVVFDADKKKNTYITLKTGAEFKITNNLSTNINFGAKAKAKEQYYNGTLGVSYKF